MNGWGGLDRILSERLFKEVLFMKKRKKILALILVGLLVVAAVPAAMSAAGFAHAGGHGIGHFVDANGDGVCDNRGAGGGNYVDANGDGVCDNRGTGCGNYVDARTATGFVTMSALAAGIMLLGTMAAVTTAAVGKICCKEGGAVMRHRRSGSGSDRSVRGYGETHLLHPSEKRGGHGGYFPDGVPEVCDERGGSLPAGSTKRPGSAG